MILRDPVHGLVGFETPETAIVRALLEAREVQRLRRVRQLGLTSLAYPGADHTRFSHALGAAHVMNRLTTRLRAIDGELPYWQRLSSERAREALAAALLHDLGHGPFSHLFEDALPDTPAHETWTERVILEPGTDVHRILRQFDPGLPQRVSELVHGRHELPYLARAVSGTFDVDRCDYLLRDAYFTGVGYGRFDLDWLLRSFCFGPGDGAGGALAGPGSVAEAPGAAGTAGAGVAAADGGASPQGGSAMAAAPHLAIDGSKGLPAIESFILARLFMFQQVYFHKASRAAECLVRRLLERLRACLLDGTPVPGVPAALEALVSEGDAPLGAYLDLDDAVLGARLLAWCDCKDPVLADLAQRLTRRHLFKTVELHGEAALPAARAHAHAVAREVARAAGLDPDVYVTLDEASDVPFDDTHEPLTVLLPGGGSQKPGDVSFLLGRLRGQRMERIRLVLAPELRAPVQAALGAP